MRLPRSGWTITFFSLLAAFIIAAALDMIEGTMLLIGAAAIVAAYFIYRHLAQR